MINLLPVTEREAIIYARRNTKLLRWLLAMVGSAACFSVFLLAGHFYIAATTASYAQQVDQTRTTLQAQNLDQTQKRAQDFSNNVKLILQVFSREVLFSKLLKQIGAVMPNRSVLSTIEISKIEGGIDLTAYAQDYNTATQIQVNLQDPSNKLFSKADIVSVTCGGNAAKTVYPCTVTLRASFAQSNPFLFITPSGNNTGSQS